MSLTHPDDQHRLTRANDRYSREMSALESSTGLPLERVNLGNGTTLQQIEVGLDRIHDSMRKMAQAMERMDTLVQEMKADAELAGTS